MPLNLDFLPESHRSNIINKQHMIQNATIFATQFLMKFSKLLKHFSTVFPKASLSKSICVYLPTYLHFMLNVKELCQIISFL